MVDRCWPLVKATLTEAAIIVLKPGGRRHHPIGSLSLLPTTHASLEPSLALLTRHPGLVSVLLL